MQVDLSAVPCSALL